MIFPPFFSFVFFFILFSFLLFTSCSLFFFIFSLSWFTLAFSYTSFSYFLSLFTPLSFASFLFLALVFLSPHSILLLFLSLFHTLPFLAFPSLPLPLFSYLVFLSFYQINYSNLLPLFSFFFLSYSFAFLFFILARLFLASQSFLFKSLPRPSSPSPPYFISSPLPPLSSLLRLLRHPQIAWRYAIIWTFIYFYGVTKKVPSLIVSRRLMELSCVTYYSSLSPSLPFSLFLTSPSLSLFASIYFFSLSFSFVLSFFSRSLTNNFTFRLSYLFFSVVTFLPLNNSF